MWRSGGFHGAACLQFASYEQMTCRRRICGESTCGPSSLLQCPSNGSADFSLLPVMLYNLVPQLRCPEWSNDNDTSILTFPVGCHLCCLSNTSSCWLSCCTCGNSEPGGIHHTDICIELDYKRFFGCQHFHLSRNVQRTS